MGRARRRGEDDWGLRRGIAAPSRPYRGHQGAIMVGAGQVEEVWADVQGLITHLSRPVLAGRGHHGVGGRTG